MLHRILARPFSAAPYNPHRYLMSYVPTKSPTDQEIHDMINRTSQDGEALVHNLRHINPIRQSGPIPPYDGPYTMEDLLKSSSQEYMLLNDRCYASNEPEEIMRRVPGITREEAEYIVTLGLTPDEEIDLAYFYKNAGIDMYYPLNLSYVARQVLTNSKGEKVEVMWPTMSWEDIKDLSVDTALQELPYFAVRHWEAFSGDEWYKYVNNQDLGVPDTWFEYERNTKYMLQIIGDQFEELSDAKRPWATPPEPHCSKELWRDQEKLQLWEEMSRPDWKDRSPDQQVNYNHQRNGSRRKKSRSQKRGYVRGHAAGRCGLRPASYGTIQYREGHCCLYQERV